MKIQNGQIGHSERAINCDWPQRENAHFLKSKLEDLRRHKERRNKFDRSQLVEQMEKLKSIKKLRSATKGAKNLEGIKKVVRRLRNSQIRSFSRKVGRADSKKSYSKERSRLKEIKIKVDSGSTSCGMSRRLERDQFIRALKANLEQNRAHQRKAGSGEKESAQKKTANEGRPGEDEFNLNNIKENWFCSFSETKVVDSASGKAGRSSKESPKPAQTEQKKVRRLYKGKQPSLLKQKSGLVVDIYRQKTNLQSTEPNEQGRISSDCVQKKLEDIQIKFGLSLHKESKSRNKPQFRNWKQTKHLRLEGLFKEESQVAQYQSLNYSIEPAKYPVRNKSGSQQKAGRSENYRQKKVHLKPVTIRNKSSAMVSNSRGNVKGLDHLKKSQNSEQIFSVREPRRVAQKKTLKNYFQRLSKIKSTRPEQVKNHCKSGKFKFDLTFQRTPDQARKKRLKVCAMNIRSMDMELSPKIRRFGEIELKPTATKQNADQQGLSSLSNLKQRVLKKKNRDLGEKDADDRRQGESVSNLAPLVETKKKRKERSEPKLQLKKTKKRLRRKPGKKNTHSYVNRKPPKAKKKKFCFKTYFKTSIGESMRAQNKANGERAQWPGRKPRKLKLHDLKLQCGDWLVKTNSVVQTSKRVAEKGLASGRVKKRKPLVIEVEAPSSQVSKQSRNYVVNDILEKKGICINLFDPRVAEGKFEKIGSQHKSKSVNRVSANIRSSIANVEREAKDKAITRRPNRRGKKRGLGDKNRNNRLKMLNLDLRTKDFSRLASPKQKKSFKLHKRDENVRNKKNVSLRKKKPTKPSTKNLMNKFNKMSYFQFKKTKRKQQKLGKRTVEAEVEEHGPRLKRGLRNFSVNKRKARWG